MKNNLFSLALGAGLILFALAPADAVRLQQGSALFDIDPATLHISAGDTLVNMPQISRDVSALRLSPQSANWQWPECGMLITAVLEGNDLRLSFSSGQPQVMNWFTLPPQAATLLLPIGEGSRIPLDNPLWQAYLVSEQTPMDTNWNLKLPLWSQEQEGKFYSWLLITPFSNEINFTVANGRLRMRSLHRFNRFNQQFPFEVLLHVGDTPLSGAIRYREYLRQSGQFSSLRDKIKIAPEGEKLIGATHLYLWGNRLLDRADVKNWPELMNYLQSPSGAGLWGKMETEARDAIKRLKGRAPAAWQQPALVEALNQALLAQAPPEPDFSLSAQQRHAAEVRRLALRQLGAYLSPA